MADVGQVFKINAVEEGSSRALYVQAALHCQE